MPDLSKVRSARTAGRQQRAQAQAKPAEPKLEVKKALDAPLSEPSREELNPLSRLLFDANLYLNGYLEALKASSSNGGPSQTYGRSDAKGIGAA